MDPARIPVVAGVGQAIERTETVDVVELAGRAADAAFDEAPRLRDRIERLSMVGVSFSPVTKAPASQVAERLGLTDVRCEVTTPGGNMPQWLVTRAAVDISAGRLGATLIVGAEATRSMRTEEPDKSFLQAAAGASSDGPHDEVIGDPMRGLVSKAEIAARLYIPTEVYALLESAMAAAAGRSFEEQRRFLGPLMSSFSRVAAGHPFAWFHHEYKPEEVSDVTPENRLIAEPYAKRMNSFPNVDQASALIVTSLAAAREAGIEDQCVFLWSGASAMDTPPATRPNLDQAPGMGAAAAAALATAQVAANDLDFIDIYSCFPAAVQAGASALGIALDDPRGLTITGGLPFFGGPGNNYSGHAIATLVERLRESGGVGYIGANGGFLSKHSIGIYGATPPPHDFAEADTSDQQKKINASALPTALDPDGTARVVAGTVVYDRDGSVASAPIVASLDDGRRIVAQADPELLGDLAGTSLIGRDVRVSGSPPTYRL